MKAVDDVIPDVDLREARDAEGCVTARFVEAGGEISPTGLLNGHLHTLVVGIVVIIITDYTTNLDIIVFRQDAGDVGEADNHSLVEISVDLLPRHRETEKENLS